MPDGWLRCHGEKVDTDRFPNLAEALGDSFGREGGVPLLPDLRSRALLGAGPDRGGSRPNPDPGRRVGERGPARCDRDASDALASLGLTYIINPHDAPTLQMIGEVRPFPYSYVPGGWMDMSGRKSADAELIPWTAVNWAIATDGKYPPRE